VPRALLAEELGLDSAFVRLIRHAAPLHDVGKVGTPDSILLKPFGLVRRELEIVRGHASAGARILGDSSSELLRLAEEIAAAHYEWWDGSGYPNGLAGEAIPLSGRIVAVADVFDALSHDRP
jgi:putative two-component system response regulator